MLRLIGEPRDAARRHAEKLTALEAALARASLTLTDRRDPYRIYHKLSMDELQALTPSFRWQSYLEAIGGPRPAAVNVMEPDFLRQVEVQLRTADLDTWKAYLRWHLLAEKAPYLASRFADVQFAFFKQYLQGITQLPPRWQRCVAWADRDLGDAVGQVFVRRAFGPKVKQRTAAMIRGIERAMDIEIQALPWMTTETKRRALEKLHKMVNKVGYPEKWRDYSSVAIRRTDFIGNIERLTSFESRRQLAKIGKPIDRADWEETPATVDAYYNVHMNDMNFPAAVLLPPLFDLRSDAAPNYGDTGAMIGHELVHAFDDRGRKFDALGSLTDWWTPNDAAEFEKRVACVRDQYAEYVVIEDIKLNSKLTVGEDVADLGGTLLAYMAWKEATHGERLPLIDGFTPDQRFFIGYAQWTCGETRPEKKRVNAITADHSPPQYRINGVVANLPEFAAAFHCKAGQPMARQNACRVW
jgi:endothelin-converting enzyme/putative endopeptidase